MGRLSRFFGKPGSRPDNNQRAPRLELDFFASDNESNNATAEAAETTEVTDQRSKCSFEENVSIVSRSDESSEEGLGTVTVEKNGDIDTSHGFTGLHKDRADRTLDKIVGFAGSQVIFFLMWVIIIIWAVIGIVYKAPNTWQVVMQDGQSIQSYIWDTLLMRQQLISTHEQTVICGVLRSRIVTCKNLIQRKLPLEIGEHEFESAQVSEEVGECSNDEIDQNDFQGDLPVEVWYDRLSSFASNLIGSLPIMIIFWCGIITWVICGVKPMDAGNTPPYTGETTGSNPRLQKFSSTWQLYINTATAVVLLICTVFLQNIRARHDKFSAEFVVNIFETDERIERTLRSACGDFESENPVVTIYAQKRCALEKMIDFYADVIGTGIGVFIACLAIGVWLGIGHLMQYDDNWWLIIGTYTGLIGFLDGFVIRQVYYRIIGFEEASYKAVAEDDLELFDLLGLKCPKKCDGTIPVERKNTLEFRISSFINRTCSSQWGVVVSVVIIIALIVIACALHWSTTGQLICNTPTMIIEAFFLIMLLQAHNWADCQRRVELTALLARKHILLSHVTERFQSNP